MLISYNSQRLTITGQSINTQKYSTLPFSILIKFFFLDFASARSLHTLRLPFGNMTNTIVEQVAPKLSTLTFLDLSYCPKIGARALEAIGKHCKLLATLCWNTHPLDMRDNLPQNDEAHAIATTMPKLVHLEIAYLRVDALAVLEIVTACASLEYLDLRGCWDVKLEEKFLSEKFQRLKVVGPHVVDQYERNDWEECSDYSSEEDEDSFYEDYESLDDGMWDEDDERIGGLQLRFYEGFDEDSSGYGWPPSP